VPQTPEPISAASRPKFTILWGHLEDILLLRLGEEKRRRSKKKPQDENIMVCPIP